MSAPELKMSAPEYLNNPLLSNFQQPDNGMGFSNFRIEPTLPDAINRNNRDFQFEQILQSTNPQTQQEYQRHANNLFREHYGDYNIIEEDKVPEDYIYLDIIIMCGEQVMNNKNLQSIKFLHQSEINLPSKL